MVARGFSLEQGFQSYYLCTYSCEIKTVDYVGIFRCQGTLSLCSTRFSYTLSREVSCTIENASTTFLLAQMADQALKSFKFVMEFTAE